MDWRTLGLCMALSFGLSQRAQAFTLNNSAGAYFKQDDVKIHLADSPCTNIGITKEALWDLAIEGAHKLWNQIPTSRLRIVRGDLISPKAGFRAAPLCSGTYPPCSRANPDLVFSNDIVIGCNDNVTTFYSNQIIAVTLPNNLTDTHIVSSLVLVNDRVGNPFGNLTDNKKIAVMAHELGHAIGLGHSGVRESLMYYTPVPVREKLGLDDIHGVTYLYPKKVELLGTSCGTVQDTHGGPFGRLETLLMLVLALGVGLGLIKVWGRISGRTRPF